MMVLVDTSVWISHFREANPELTALLNRGAVLCHPYVVGELACGNLKNRSECLMLLKELPMAVEAEHPEVLVLLESGRYHGRGLGWVDVHLFASARLSGAPLWTLDKALSKVARESGHSYDPPHNVH